MACLENRRRSGRVSNLDFPATGLGRLRKCAVIIGLCNCTGRNSSSQRETGANRLPSPPEPEKFLPHRLTSGQGMRRSADNSRSRPRARVVWDEANLEYLDANKSPKQKITEPKTPYYVPTQDDGSISPIASEGRKFDQATQAEQIKHALMEVASSSSSQQKSKGGWTSSEDEADDMDQETEDVETSNHSKNFQEQRKAHYDEFRKLKAIRQTLDQPEEDQESQPMEKEYSPTQTGGLSIKGSDGL